jgi:hypothetical protein
MQPAPNAFIRRAAIIINSMRHWFSFDMTKRSLILLMMSGGLAITAGVQAATDTQTQRVKAKVKPRAKLSISASTLTFSDADPDDNPSITNDEGVITITAKVRTDTNANPMLTVIADQDLTDDSVTPVATIPISNITWSGTGDLEAGGASSALSKDTPVTLSASWTGPGVRTGTITFQLVNSWSYASGNYSAKLTYALTAP